MSANMSIPDLAAEFVAKKREYDALVEALPKEHPQRSALYFAGSEAMQGADKAIRSAWAQLDRLTQIATKATPASGGPRDG